MAKSTKPAKVLVFCPLYDGRYKDVHFMMQADDFRLQPKADGSSWGYELVDAAPVYDHKARTLTTCRGVFAVHGDWSLTPKA